VKENDDRVLHCMVCGTMHRTASFVDWYMGQIFRVLTVFYWARLVDLPTYRRYHQWMWVDQLWQMQFLTGVLLACSWNWIRCSSVCLSVYLMCYLHRV